MYLTLHFIQFQRINTRGFPIVADTRNWAQSSAFLSRLFKCVSKRIENQFATRLEQTSSDAYG